jgi:hypothetical protein
MSRGSRWACCIHRKLTLYVPAVICPQNRNAWSVRAALVGSLQRKVNLNVLHKLKLVQATPKEENRFHANPLLSITCRLTGALAMVPGEILNRQTIVMPLMWCASINELRCAAHAMRDKPATTVAIRMMTPCTSSPLSLVLQFMRSGSRQLSFFLIFSILASVSHLYDAKSASALTKSKFC